VPNAFPDLGEIRFRRRRDAGDVLNATVRFLRANLRELLRTYLVVVLPVALASGVAIGLYLAQVGDLFSDPAAFEANPLGLFNGTYVGVLLFGLLGSALTLAAAGAYVRLYREGRAGTVTAGELWDEAKGLILPFVGLFLAYAVVMVVSMPIAIVPCLGALAWLALALWLVPRVMVTVAVRTLERPTLIQAWGRSKDLVDGSWRFAFGALLLAGVVYYAAILILSIPLSVVMMVAGLNGAGEASGMMSTLGILYAPLQVLSYAGILIPVLAAFFVHGRLVEELEGTSLYGDLDALAAEAGTAPRSTAPGLRSTPTEAPPADAPDGPDAPPPSGFRGGGFRGGGFRG